MIDLILSFFGENLIELMVVMLITALTMRFTIYNSSNKHEAYFSQFTRELTATIDEDKSKNVEFDDTDAYLTNLLGRVNQKLPHKTLRSKESEKRVSSQALKDYVGSKHGLIASIQSESSVFNCRVPPNWPQLTDRIMSEDKNWTNLLGFINIGQVTRFLDILPSLFIIFGVFGTFIGISMALPEIAKIDFSNLESSGQTLTQFVINVTFAMKTSVAGIAFSIILTLLNTVFPTEELRERTFEKVETALQVLWYHIQKDHKESSVDLLVTQMIDRMDKLIAITESNNEVRKKGAA